MIGLHFTKCVEQIALGSMPEHEVELIVCNTMMFDDEDFAQVTSACFALHWWRMKEALDIAWRLWKSGRIVQPRLTGGHVRRADGAIWVNSLDGRL